MKQFTRLELNKLQLAVTQAIPGRLACLRNNAKLSDPFWPANMDAMVFQLLTYVNETNHTIERRTVRVPLTWFDHLKESLFPYWLTKIFPVKYKSIEITTINKFLCPHLYVEGDNQTHVMYLSQGEDNLK